MRIVLFTIATFVLFMNVLLKIYPSTEGVVEVVECCGDILHSVAYVCGDRGPIARFSSPTILLEIPPYELQSIPLAQLESAALIVVHDCLTG
jgi:hypothetical protein